MIRNRLLAIALTAGLAGSVAWVAAPAASAAPLTCYRGNLEGTFTANNFIYTSSSLMVVAGPAKAGDVFGVSQIDPGYPAKYLGSDITNGVSGWVTSTELTNTHCVPD